MKLAMALLRLLFRAALAAALITLLSWTLVECAPGSTAERAALASRIIAAGDIETPPEHQREIIAEIARQHDLDDTFWERSMSAAGRVLVLDFGRSWRDETPVSDLLLAGPGLRTLSVCLVALCLAFALGVLGALTSARRPASLSDRGWGLYVALVLSIPLPWIAMVAIRSLAYGQPLALFPPGGLDSPMHALLPVLVMASAPMAVLWRHAREELLVISRRHWVVAARARGNPEQRIWRAMILRAALPRVLSLAPVLLAYLFAASFVVERVFGIEGAGELVARAAAAGDAPVLIAFAAMSVGLVSCTSSLVDIVVKRIDPRRAELS